MSYTLFCCVAHFDCWAVFCVLYSWYMLQNIPKHYTDWYLLWMRCIFILFVCLFFERENDLLDAGPRIFFHSESEQEQTVFRRMRNFSSPPQWEKKGGFSHWCRSGIASNAPRRADDVCLLSFQPTPSAPVTKCDFNVWHFHPKRSEITCRRL